MKETINPQHALFKKHYLDPKGTTFGNVSGSLVKAGYSQSYADNASALKPDWLYNIIGTARRARMFEKSEEVLENTLKMPAVDEEGKTDNNLLKTQVDIAKFVSKGIGKQFYSERTEMTGAEGKDIQFVLNETLTKRDAISPDTD